MRRAGPGEGCRGHDGSNGNTLGPNSTLTALLSLSVLVRRGWAPISECQQNLDWMAPMMERAIERVGIERVGIYRCTAHQHTAERGVREAAEMLCNCGTHAGVCAMCFALQHGYDVESHRLQHQSLQHHSNVVGALERRSEFRGLRAIRGVGDPTGETIC